MTSPNKRIIATMMILLTRAAVTVAQDDDPLQAWRSDVKVQPLLNEYASFHSIHTYYTTLSGKPRRPSRAVLQVEDS
jgi:hypothetical protein